MSGHSYLESCPNCGKDMACYTDSKPIDYIHGECLSCGFHYETNYKMMTKDELDDLRNEQMPGDMDDIPDTFDPLVKVEDFL